MLCKIFCSEQIEQSLVDYLENNYSYRHIAFFVDEEKMSWFNDFERKLKTVKTRINEQNISELISCVVCVGNGKIQNFAKQFVKNLDLEINFVQLSLEGVGYFQNAILSNGEVESINQKYNVFFSENEIKKSDYCANLGIYSFLLSRYTALFEKEYYARIFNAQVDLSIKKDVLRIISKLSGILNKKIENVEFANLRILECVLEYAELHKKYSILQELTSVEFLAVELSKNIFSDPSENYFVSSVFLTSLYEKYFRLSFENTYCCDYYKKANLMPEKWCEKISMFNSEKITSEICYKIKVNKPKFIKEVYDMQRNFIIAKYDFLGLFVDFGYSLLDNLKKCDIKKIIELTAEKSDKILLNQIRNFGLLDF